MTDDRYKSLYTPMGESTISVVDANGSTKQPDHLSRGTREQLYLALRFGLIREFGIHTEPLPVIVDEVLVNFDPERAQRAAKAFTDLSGTSQGPVFACHPNMVEAFNLACAHSQVIELSSPWSACTPAKATVQANGDARNRTFR